MFEYLMPLLLMRTYPGHAARPSLPHAPCGARSTTARARGVPWGISESAFNVVDRARQLPVQGVRRARAWASSAAWPTTWWSRRTRPRSPPWSIPRAAARTSRASPRAGCEGRYGFYEALDYTAAQGADADGAAHRGHAAGRRRARVHRAPPGHDAGRARERAARRRRWCERFHADPRVQATELLLQERVPRDGRVDPAAAGRGDAARRRTRRRRRCGASASPHTRLSRTRSSCRTAATSRSSPTPAAAPARGADVAVTRQREDATRDPGSQFLYLRDVRSGAVWSATYQPTCREPDDYLVDVPAGQGASFRRTRRRHRDAARDRGLARGRRRGAPALAHQSRATGTREIEVTSYVELVLGAARRTTSRTRRSASCSSRPSTCRTARRCSAAAARASRRRAGAWAVHVLSVEGRTQGPIEWETDRARFLGRGRDARRARRARRPRALGHHRRGARSRRQPAPARPARAGRLGAPGVRDRRRAATATRRARSRRSTTTPARPRARSRSPSRTAQMRAAPPRASRARTRSSSSASRRACSIVGRLAARRPRRAARANALGPVRPVGARHLGRPADPARRVSSRTTTCRWCGRCCRRRNTGGSRACSADVVILNEHPVELPRRDARAARGAARERAVGGLEATGRAACSCCAATACRTPSACCSRPSRARC